MRARAAKPPDKPPAGSGESSRRGLGAGKRAKPAARAAPQAPPRKAAGAKHKAAGAKRKAARTSRTKAGAARPARAAAKPARWIPSQPTGSIFERSALEAASAELSGREKRLALLLRRFPPEPRERPANLFRNLCRTVCAQMLSNAAANTIFGRMAALCERSFTPASIAALSVETLRNTGLSRAKVASVRALADYFAQDGNLFSRLEQASDEEVEGTLLSLRGLGPWSAEMFMLFSLGRMDIYSARDAALATGLIKLKRLPAETGRARLDALAARYSPYRSVVSLALWQWRHHNWERLEE